MYWSRTYSIVSIDMWTVPEGRSEEDADVSDMNREMERI